jgi:hypothetical protein
MKYANTAAAALTLSLILTGAALADPAPATSPSPAPSVSPSPAPSCQVLRNASATTYVNKSSLTQVNGVWTVNDQFICSTTDAEVNVVSQAQGCSYSPILTCEAILDGVNHRITVSGLIWLSPATSNTPAMKTFGVSYYFDQSQVTGFSGSVTHDLGLQETGIIVDPSRTKTADGTAYNDTLNISVNFDDANAQ